MVNRSIETVQLQYRGEYSTHSLYMMMYWIIIFFYRAMHFSAKRGIAIACRPSVRPSVT